MAAVEVVGAVIVRDGLVLCAQRSPTAMLSGSWEFPGGKVETGEHHRDALVREIQEELGCTVSVDEFIVTTTHEYEFATVSLTTYFCDLVAGEPVAAEHAALEWIAARDLESLAWAAADVPTVQLVMTRLSSQAD